jgi:Ala-tRNA(Pro) deacylase
MTVFDQIVGLLDSQSIHYQLFTHLPTRTCADSARVRGTSTDQGAKALVCYADKLPILIVLPCSRKLDSKKFKSTFRVNDLHLATPEQVFQLTSLHVGSIPPFGHLFSLPLYIDQTLSSQHLIAFNAGDHSRSVVMTFVDYNNIAHGQIASFSTSSD